MINSLKNALSTIITYINKHTNNIENINQYCSVSTLTQKGELLKTVNNQTFLNPIYNTVSWKIITPINNLITLDCTSNLPENYFKVGINENIDNIIINNLDNNAHAILQLYKQSNDIVVNFNGQTILTSEDTSGYYWIGFIKTSDNSEMYQTCLLGNPIKLRKNF